MSSINATAPRAVRVRHRFLQVTMRSSLIVVTLGAAMVLAIGVAIGNA